MKRFMPSEWLAERIAAVTEEQVAAEAAKLTRMEPGFTVLGEIGEEHRKLFVAYIGLNQQLRDLQEKIRALAAAAGMEDMSEIGKLSPERREEMEDLGNRFNVVEHEGDVLQAMFWLGVNQVFEEKLRRMEGVDLGIAEGFRAVTRPSKKESEPEAPPELRELLSAIEEKLQAACAKGGPDNDASIG